MRVASDMPCRHERKTTPCEGWVFYFVLQNKMRFFNQCLKKSSFGDLKNKHKQTTTKVFDISQ